MQTIVQITMMVLMATVLSVPFAPSDAQIIDPCKEIMITVIMILGFLHVL